MEERVVILIKPDAVKRRLIGEILKRFEQCGLKIIALKMVKPEREEIEKHYPDTEDWYRRAGEKTLKNCKEMGISPKDYIQTDDPVEIGKLIKKWNIDYLTEGPCVVALLEGKNAIECARKIVGATLPKDALPGTIRGDFSTDSAIDSLKEKRAIRNLVHASGNKEEREAEQKLWFSEGEIFEY